MRLIALLDASDPVHEGPDGVLPSGAIRFGVQTPVEYQARQAIAAGAQALILHRTAPSAEIGGIADRLARESGIPVGLVADSPALVRQLENDDRVMLIGERMIIPQHALELLALEQGPALLATPTEPRSAHFERIDGRFVWAGAALLPAPAVLSTVDMLGDWDLILTLMRRAIQLDARRIDLSSDLVASGHLARLADQADADRALDVLAHGRADADDRRDILSALFAPVERPLLAEIVRREMDPARIGLGAGALGAAAMAAATVNWPAIAQFLALVALAALHLASAAAGVSLRRPMPYWLRLLVEGTGLASLAIVGGRLAEGRALALAGVWLPLALVALLALVPFESNDPGANRWLTKARLTTASALTIGLFGTIIGRPVETFVALALFSFGTVANRLLAGLGKRI